MPLVITLTGAGQHRQRNGRRACDDKVTHDILPWYGWAARFEASESPPNPRYLFTTGTTLRS